MPRQRTQPKPPFPPQGLTPPGIEADMDPRPHYKAPKYKAAGKLEGLIALITGGDSGIGRSVAVLFAREGADVAIVYLPEEQVDADETARVVQEAGRSAVLIPGDVTDPEFCDRAVKQTVEELGKLDILVNNAAFQQHLDAFEDITLEQWDKTFKTNIYGYFYMAKAAIEHLPRGGSIINCGSITGLEGNDELIDYSSTKGAIHAFTKSMASHLIDRGIRVNCVAPGPVWTPLNPAEHGDEAMREFGAGTPLGRPAQPEEIAPAFVFFASEADSGYISGEVLPLLGGRPKAG
ncbi:MAG: SDR family oxidoreductase [Planctomyces sp.]|nr:SDR family oxidoreductase [Planctomyces sp.]